MFYHPHITNYCYLALPCSSFIILVFYHPHPLSSSSFIILIFCRLHPPSFIILVLYHPRPLSSSSFIILILYHPHPLSSSSFIILILYRPHLSSSAFIIFIFHYLSFIIYDPQIHPHFHLHYPHPYRPCCPYNLPHHQYQARCASAGIKPRTFSPGVFWRARAPNNATPIRQNLEAGAIPGQISPM